MMEVLGHCHKWQSTQNTSPGFHVSQGTLSLEMLTSRRAGRHNSRPGVLPGGSQISMAAHCQHVELGALCIVDSKFQAHEDRAKQWPAGHEICRVMDSIGVDPLTLARREWLSHASLLLEHSGSIPCPAFICAPEGLGRQIRAWARRSTEALNKI